MSKQVKHVLDTENHYDDLINEIEKLDPNNLFSVVPGSRLQKKLSIRKKREKTKTNRSAPDGITHWS